MITFKELLKEKELNDLTPSARISIITLHERINIIRTKYGKAMIVTSCFRTEEEHMQIYAKKGITDKSKIPMNSKHLTAEAVDIYDPFGRLKEWIKQNTNILEEVGLWCEDFDYTPTWVHFQIVPPASGKRFFKP